MARRPFARPAPARLALVELEPRETPATFTWTGNGGNDFFMTPGNWGGTAPSPAGVDSLVFPASTRLTPFNNFSDAVFESVTIEVGGYVIGGFSFAVNAGGVTGSLAAGTAKITPTVRLAGAAQTVTTTNAGATLEIATIDLDNVPSVTFAGAGRSVVSGFSGISGNGDVVVDTAAGGSVELRGQVTSNGTTLVKSGLLLLDAFGTAGPNLVIGDGAGAAKTAEVRLLRGGLGPFSSPIPSTTPVTIAADGFLNLNNFDSSMAGLTGTSPNAAVTTGTVTTNTLSIEGKNEYTFPGKVTGNGKMRVINGLGDGIGQTFTGPVTLTGDAVSVTVSDGQLYVNGTLSGSAAGVLLANGGRLGGAGTAKSVTGFVTFTHNQIRPGTEDAPGVLTLTGDADFNFTDLRVRVNGTTPGTGNGKGYDQLVVGGKITGSNAELLLELTPGYTPQAGQQLLVLDNRGTGSIPGSFVGLPDGKVFDAGGGTWRISYTGGDGNDVTITEVSAPTVTVARAAGQPAAATAGPLVFDVVFSGAVVGFDESTVQVLAPGVTGIETTVTPLDLVGNLASRYRVELAGLTGQGTVTVLVPSGVAVSAAGTPNEASNGDAKVAFDNVAPAVTFDSPVTGTATKLAAIPVTVLFSEPVSGFTAAGLSATNGTVSGFNRVSDTKYTFTLTPAGDGKVTATVAAGAAADDFGNPNAAAAFTRTSDRTAPGVTVTPVTAGPTNAAAVTFRVVFTEPVTGFDPADVILAGSTAAGTLSAAVSGAGTVFTVTVTGMDGPGDVAVAVGAGAAADAAGNPSAAAAAPAVVAFDNTRPTATVVPATDQPQPVTGLPIRFTVTFSQPVTGFTEAGVVLGGTAGPTAVLVSGSGTTYSVLVSGAAQAGTVTVAVAEGAAADAIGNTNLASAAAEVTYQPTTSPPPPPGSPTISDVADVTTPAGTAVGPISFVIGDGETPTANLVVTAASSNTALIPAGGITLGGTGSGRTVTVTPAGGQAGTAVITLTVTDADGKTDTDTFTVTVTTSPPTVPPPGGASPRLVGYRQFAAGADRGAAGVVLYESTASFLAAAEPFGSFTGGVRTAAGDFNGDGVADLVVGTGPGRATRVRVLDGKDQRELFAVDPFEAAFTGGIYVAAGDVTGDGKADLVITPDEGGGPRCRVFDGTTFALLADFFGIDDPAFRGGARAAVGDVDGDGFGDLVVAAGFQGGPRVAAFSGKTLGSGPVKLFNDFFAFEQTLRNGVFIAAGDLDGDGKAEVIAGGGPGGGPRVTAFSGADLINSGGGTLTPLANFFGGDDANRGGVRVAVKDLDGDTRADVVVGSGTGAGSRVTGYLGKNIAPAGTPTAVFDFDAFPGFAGGVFVG